MSPTQKSKNKIGLPLAEIHGKLAVAKAVNDDDYRSLNSMLRPGTHLIDLQFSLEGTLKKGEPFHQRFPAKVNPWKLLAKALNKLNATTIDALVRETLESDPLDEANAVKLAAEQAIERLVETTEQEVTGRLTAALVLKLL